MNGDKYEGMWKNGKAHGQGIYFKSQTNDHYEGMWRNHLKHGQGVEILADGR